MADDPCSWRIALVDLWFLMSGVVTVSTVVKTVMSAVFGAMTLILLFVTTIFFHYRQDFITQ